MATNDSPSTANIENFKDQFLTILSHELRTPMTITKGYISMILEGTAGEINPKVRDFLTEIYNGNERLIRLVNDMEKVVQIDTNQFVYDIQPTPIFPVVSEIVSKLTPKARNKEINVRLTIPDDPYLSVLTDKNRLTEVLFCLIENAIKFTDNGEVVIGSEESVVNSVKCLVIKVKDTGIGIPEHFHSQIFHKFTHVNYTLTDQRGGTGLGLYIAKKLLEAMNSSIWVESKEGVGSTFSISLPLAIGKAQ